jgi:glycosyltransferase involved in cell wall biosynthesis
MSAVPRLTVGLPVFNGETFVAESIEALLGQSFEDFELIISDNASTDGTEEICRQYERQDSRIRYFRQPRNIGLAPNHNFTLHEARGDLIKWASHDDLYARDLLKLCVEALDESPEVVLAHAWTAMIDSAGRVTSADKYPLTTASRHAPERFRSTLFASGGDDDGGVIRTAVLRRTATKESYHHADRTIISELALHGPFYHVPQWLYFRRDCPERAERKHTSIRARCANMDPRRADPVRNPVIRLYAEYVWAYIAAIHRSPLSPEDRRECYKHLASWLASRARPGRVPQAAEPRRDGAVADIPIDALVPGRQRG